MEQNTKRQLQYPDCRQVPQRAETRRERKNILLIILFILNVLPFHSGAQLIPIINTIAGFGSGNGSSGDGGPALYAGFNSPIEVAVDKEGNLYISDVGNFYTHLPVSNSIRKINTSGIISTIAGGGPLMNGKGDGGPATGVDLGSPFAVAVDDNENIYIGDRPMNTVRKVNAAGIINTIAGSAENSGCTGDGGIATNATLTWPEYIAIDPAGNIFIADRNCSRVRRIDTLGIISTVAGGGTTGVPGDGGPATAAGFGEVVCVALDNKGNIFIGENYRVRKVDGSGIISTIAGNGLDGDSGDGGLATLAQVSLPNSIAIDKAGNIYFTDFGNDRIRKIDPSGIITTFAGTTDGYSGDGGPATAAQLSGPNSVALDDNGNMYVVDYRNSLVREISLGRLDNNNIALPTETIQIYPNPTTFSFTLTLPQTNNPATITITNLLGAIIETRTIQNTQPQTFNLHTPPGTYLIQVTTGTNTWREKIEIW